MDTHAALELNVGHEGCLFLCTLNICLSLRMRIFYCEEKKPASESLISWIFSRDSVWMSTHITWECCCTPSHTRSVSKAGLQTATLLPLICKFGAQLHPEDKVVWHSHQRRCHWVHWFLPELWGGGDPARFPAAAAPQPPPREAPGDDPLISAMHGLEQRCWCVSIYSQAGCVKMRRVKILFSKIINSLLMCGSSFRHWCQ